MAGNFEMDGCNCPNPVYIMISGARIAEIFPLNYNVKDTCKMLGSPSEGGLQQCDHKVVQPRVVSFTGILKKSYYHEIKGYRHCVEAMNMGTALCSFMGRGGQVNKMFLTEFEEIGNSNRLDSVEVKFTLTEYLEHNKEND